VKEEGPRLSPALEALLRDAREGDPDPRVVERVSARLSPLLGADPAPPSVSDPPAPAPPSLAPAASAAIGMGLTAKIAGLTVLVIAVALAMWLALRRGPGTSPARETETATLPETVAVAIPARGAGASGEETMPAAADDRESAPPTAELAAGGAGSEPPIAELAAANDVESEPPIAEAASASDDRASDDDDGASRELGGARGRPTASEPDLAAEALLVERARQALARDPARTLALARRHRELHRGGAHAEELAMLSIEALAALGRHDDARREARAFLARHPSSIYRQRIERALGPR
jgi:hypothetical protein